MFKRYYEDELEFMREMGAEFAAAYPDIASELGLESRDPDVERLLQGFAFLSANVRQQLDAEYPELVYPVMNLLWPQAVRPTPASCIVEFKPRRGVLREVLHVQRGAELEAVPVMGTGCRFRTTAPLDVLPLDIEDVRWEAKSSSRETIRLCLRAFPGVPLNRALGPVLRMHLHGSVRQAYTLFCQVNQNLEAITVRATGDDPDSEVTRRLPASSLEPLGWGEEETLLPYPPNSFRGYRHIHEYLTFPAKYLFVGLRGLDRLPITDHAEKLEICFELSAPEGESIDISGENFRLNCVPAVNLFRTAARPIRVDGTRNEYRVVPEGTHPEHLEVYSVESLTGYSRRNGRHTRFCPYFGMAQLAGERRDTTCYQLHTRPSVRYGGDDRARREGSYPAVDTFVSLVEDSGGPVREACTVSIDLLATNRDLPLKLAVGDLSVPTTDVSSGVTYSNLAAFSIPAPAPVGRDGILRYASHMLAGVGHLASRDSLVALLTLYNTPALYDRRARKGLEQLCGALADVRAVAEERVFGRPPALVRGSHLEVKLHETRFAQAGEVYLFGLALEHLVAELATVNTYSRVTITGLDRGLEFSWPPRVGARPLM